MSPRDTLQQMRNSTAAARVRYEAHHADCASVNVDTVRLRKKGVALRNFERSGGGTAAENEQPGLPFSFQIPRGIWTQIDPFEYELWNGNKKSPFGGKPARSHLKISWSGVRHHNGAVDVKLSLPPGIEQTECRVAPLLKFCNDKTGTNRVNCPGGHGNDIAYRHCVPHDQIRDRAVIDGFAQLPRCQTSTKAEGDLGLGGGAQDVPDFGLAVRQAHRTRKCIVRMYLDGKWLTRKQQLEQEGRIYVRVMGSLVPNFANSFAVVAYAAPGKQI